MKSSLVVAVVNALVLATLFLLLTPSPARACSCAGPKPLDEAIAESEWVFVGRQVDRRESGQQEVRPEDEDWFYGPILLEIEVITVFKGDVPSTVELFTGRGGGDCGTGFSGRTEVGFTVTPRDDGLTGVSSCGGSVRADALRLEFEPLPGRVGAGAPGFLIGTDVGPARVAILDTSGELLAYGEGDGRLTAAAVCPGAKKIVEIVEPERSYFIGGTIQPWVEIRDVATLDIEQTFELNISERNHSALNGMGWVLDLECHDADAGFFSYLLPNGEHDSRAGSNLPGPAKVHLWRDGLLDIVEAGEARAIAVDAHTDVFYAITGKKGTNLETRDFAGQLINSADLHGEHVGWRLALSPTGAELGVLARARPMGRDNWFYAEVNRLLVIDLPTGDSESYKLEHKGFAGFLESVDGTFMASVGRWEEGTTEVSRLEGDGAVLVGTYPVRHRGLFAMGSETVILGANSRDSSDAVHALRLDIATGDQYPIDGLVASRIAYALPAGTTITNLPPPPPSTTAPPAGAAPDTTSGASESVSGTLPPVAIDPSAPGDATGDGASIWAVTGIGVLLLAAAAGITMTLRRRSRSETG